MMRYWRLSLGNLSPIAEYFLVSEELLSNVINYEFSFVTFAVGAASEWLSRHVGHGFSAVRPLTN